MLERLAVRTEHVADWSVLLDPPAVEPDGPLGDALDRGEVVRDEHEGGAGREHRPHAIDAALLEPGVADGEHLVDEQHVGLEEGRDAEAEPHLHAARVELDLAVDGVLELGELDDVVEAGGHHPARQPEQRAVQVDVLAPGQLGVDAGAHLDQRTGAAGDLDPAGVRVHHPGQDLQQRRLARAVDPDQADRLAGLDPEVDVLERPAPAAAASTVPVPLGVGGACPQRLPRRIGPEPLPDVRGDDRAVRRHRQSPSPSA